MGEDPGFAALHDVALLSAMTAMMAGVAHAFALVRDEDVPLQDFAPMLSGWLAAMSGHALRAHPPGTRLTWVRTSLSPRALATTRLAEHWAHAQDITVPLGLAYPDTDRLRHIAWLAHRTLPYAFSVAGRPDAAVFCDLTAPDGTHWTFGDAAAPNRITGPAAQFCRVGARRLAPEQTDLTAEGPQAAEALRLVRNYAA